MCVGQLMGPWSSNSGSSCQSSLEIKEFFHDDELIDPADRTLGTHVSLHDDVSTHSSAGTSILPQTAQSTCILADSPADNTLTAAGISSLIIHEVWFTLTETEISVNRKILIPLKQKRKIRTRPPMTELLIPRIQESARITWPLTLTLSTPWMHADLESILWRFGGDPAICLWAEGICAKVYRRTDRRRTPRHCISSFLEWAKNETEKFEMETYKFGYLYIRLVFVFWWW